MDSGKVGIRKIGGKTGKITVFQMGDPRYWAENEVGGVKMGDVGGMAKKKACKKRSKTRAK
ncbi:MAG: hypothetical protein JW720_06470 [Sedimentisphaerales bacterium]|nr:hypothetical protein [Sedimentisphaerales bacterium]